MKKAMLIAAALSASFAAAPAFANLQLAQQKACMSCHAVDKKVVGPSYKEVAAKYREMIPLYIKDYINLEKFAA